MKKIWFVVFLMFVCLPLFIGIHEDKNTFNMKHYGSHDYVMSTIIKVRNRHVVRQEAMKY